VFGKDNIGRLSGVVLATTCATLVAVIAYGIWPELRAASLLLVWIGFWIAFYATGVWASIVRPAELAKKIPVSSKELRRRTKNFYDQLAGERSAKNSRRTPPQ